MQVKEISSAITENINKVIRGIEDETIEQMINAITTSNRIFVVGGGRSGLSAKSFAHRIVDLGYKVFVIGETITPSAEEGDLIIAISGSGETTFTLNAVEIGKNIGAKILAITSYPQSTIGKRANIIVNLKGREEQTKKKDYLTRQITGIHEPLSPEGATFELACMVFLESIIIKLKEIKESKDISN